MSDEGSHRMVVRIQGEERAIQVVRPHIGPHTGPHTGPHSELEQLSTNWRATQSHAHAAYQHWTRELTGEAYAVYRAAQDRADAAQDHLAEHATRTVA